MQVFRVLGEKMSRLALLVSLLVALIAAASIRVVRRESSADVILVNCRIWTADTSQPWADSLAISKGRVLRVGARPFVEKVSGPATESLDLGGKFVTPGFIDSHVHFIPGGLEMAKLNLHNVQSRKEFEQMVADAAHGVEGDRWILGSGWSNEKWGGEWPTRSWIDKVAGRHPVWLIRVDGHMGLANTAALEKCQLLNDTLVDPDGGTIVRDEDNVPTGLLAEAAMELILPCVPKPSLEDRRTAFVRAGRHALSKGVTSVIDFGAYFPGAPTEQVWQDFDEIYLWADAVGNMSVRASLYFPLETWQRVAALVKERGHTLSSWLRIGGVKAFADGSLGSGTALFHEPYADDPSNYGLHVADPAWLARTADEATASGLHVAVHAIGDAANDEVLSIYRSVNSKHHDKAHRHRIEHAQHLSPGAHAKFSRNSVIASVQPEHLMDDAFYAARKLGDQRSLRSYNFRSLLGNGTILALGSDWPVAPLDPLRGISAAVKRIPRGWDHAWIEGECITVADALTGFTISAAYAAEWEEMVGSLEPGKMADFVVLSKSPFEDGVLPSVAATYVGGVEVFSGFHPELSSEKSQAR